MDKSESIAKLAASLAKVQANLKPAAKNATNPFFKSDYADLGSVVNVARSLLGENGLSVAQFPGETFLSESGAAVELTTILMHESGEWLSQSLTMPIVKRDPQAYGSAITYARRYALASVVGIVTGEDDDGQGAGSGQNGQRKAPNAKQAPRLPAVVEKANDDLGLNNSAVSTTEPKQEPESTALDWREKIATSRNMTERTVCSIVINACPYYKAEQHAFNALAEYPFPNGIEHDLNQRVDSPQALAIYDWLLERATRGIG